MYILCRKKKGESDDVRYGSKTLLEQNTELLGQYKPRTQETRQTYEVLLALIQESIGDQVAWAILQYG